MSTTIHSASSNSIINNTQSQPQPQPINTSSSSSSSSSYATIQIRDALIKFSLYIQKVITLQDQQQQLLSKQHNNLQCHKLIRLSLETFTKYSQSQQFAKQSYQLCKSFVMNKKSYYSLIMIDLMVKNSKYIIKVAKKQVEGLFRIVWERVYVQSKGYDQQKVENLKIMVRCWGCVYGDRLEESVRKWLDSKYGIKRIQLNEQNQKALRQVYYDNYNLSNSNSNSNSNNMNMNKRPDNNNTLPNNRLLNSNNNKNMNNPNISSSATMLLNSLVGEDDDNIKNNNNNNRNIINNSTTTTTMNTNINYNANSSSLMQRSISRTSQSLLVAGQQGNKGNSNSSKIKKPSTTSNTLSYSNTNTNTNSSSSNNNSNRNASGSSKLQGVNKSLLEALDLQ